MAILEQRGISTTGQRAPYLLARASYDRLICQGATIRNDPTYQLLPAAPSGVPQPDNAEAVAELARRYFKSRGPATLADFGWWSGLPMADIKRAVASLGDELIEDRIDGQTYWRHAATPSATNDLTRAYLLPGFDEYLLSYKDRSAVMDIAYMKTLTPTNGMMPPTMVYDGQVIGTWRRTLQKKSVSVALNPYAPLSVAQIHAFEKALELYQAFIGLPTTFTG